MTTSQSTSGIVGNEALMRKPGAVASSVMSQWQDEQAQSKIHLTGSKEELECCFFRLWQSERGQLLTDLVRRRLGEEDVCFLTTSRLLVTFTSCFSRRSFFTFFFFLPHKHTGHLGNYEVRRRSSVWDCTPPCLALISIKTPGESKDANVHDNCMNLARNCHCKISRLFCPLNILPQILNWSFWQLGGLRLERCGELNCVILSPGALCWGALSRDK